MRPSSLLLRIKTKQEIWDGWGEPILILWVKFCFIWRGIWRIWRLNLKCQHVLKGSKPISDMENKKKKKEKKKAFCPWDTSGPYVNVHYCFIQTWRDRKKTHNARAIPMTMTDGGVAALERAAVSARIRNETSVGGLQVLILQLEPWSMTVISASQSEPPLIHFVINFIICQTRNFCCLFKRSLTGAQENDKTSSFTSYLKNVLLDIQKFTRTDVLTSLSALQGVK